MGDDPIVFGPVVRGEIVGETFLAFCARTGTERGRAPKAYPVPDHATWDGKRWNTGFLLYTPKREH